MMASSPPPHPPFFFLAAIVTLIVGLSPFPFTAHLCTYICDPLTLFFYYYYYFALAKVIVRKRNIHPVRPRAMYAVKAELYQFFFLFLFV